MSASLIFASPSYPFYGQSLQCSIDDGALSCTGTFYYQTIKVTYSEFNLRPQKGNETVIEGHAKYTILNPDNADSCSIDSELTATIATHDEFSYAGRWKLYGTSEHSVGSCTLDMAGHPYEREIIVTQDNNGTSGSFVFVSPPNMRFTQSFQCTFSDTEMSCSGSTILYDVVFGETIPCEYTKFELRPRIGDKTTLDGEVETESEWNGGICQNSATFAAKRPNDYGITLISPRGTVSTDSPEFGWTAVSGATSYMTVVETGPSHTKIIEYPTPAMASCSDGTGECYYYLVHNIQRGGDHMERTSGSF